MPPSLLPLGPDASSDTRVHGGLQDGELQALGLQPDDVLDFSSSTNPYGPAPAMLRALSDAAIGRYPDPSGRRARQALAALEGVSVNEIVLGNGAADLLWSLARRLLGPGRTLLSVEPTFCELGAAARACGARVIESRSREQDGFAIDLAGVEQAARAAGADVIYLCSPNTPTGSALPIASIAAFSRRLSGVWLVLDQSFLSLSELHADAGTRLPPHVVCVRSLTKDHGIPGVRVGYAITDAALCEALEASRPAWTTSAFAQAAALASCHCQPFVAESRERLLEDRRALARDLASLGVETLPSRTTFLLARLPAVAELRRALLSRHRILVRDCASFGLPGFVRLGAKPEGARERLIESLRREGVAR
jgi:histidinol-phosphate/aromatic aminotransferase/cobyric acid decarboxylase-like protein